MFLMNDEVKVAEYHEHGGRVGKIVSIDREKNHLTNVYTIQFENADNLPTKTGRYDEGDLEFASQEYLTEMAGRIPGVSKIPGKPKKPGLFIVMGGDEKSIQHFHVYRNGNDMRAWKNGACLFFKENRYYDHGDNKETLDKDELAAVVKTLKSPHISGKHSNWEHMVMLWNDNNEKYMLDFDIKMPEYNIETIKRYKEK